MFLSIRVKPSTLDTQAQNRRVERLESIIKEKARAI